MLKERGNYIKDSNLKSLIEIEKKIKIIMVDQKEKL